MRRLMFLVIVGLLMLSLIVPAASACEGGKCVAKGDLGVEVSVEFVGLPDGIKPNAGYSGFAVGTVSVDPKILAAFGKKGVAGAGYNYDNYTWVYKNGAYYAGELSAPTFVSAMDMGWKPKVKIVGSNQIQLWVPIQGTAPMYNGGGGTIEFAALTDTFASWYAYAFGKGAHCYAGDWIYDIARAKWVIRIFTHMDWKPVATDVKGLVPPNTRWADIWGADLDPNGDIYKWQKYPNWHINAPDEFTWSILPLGQQTRPILYRFCATDGHQVAPVDGSVYAVGVPHMGNKYASFHLWEENVEVLTWDEVEEVYGVRP